MTPAPTIEEGRCLERRCPHCGNAERRAFGEFESMRGELASYAIGWTSEHEDVVAHMTIGIGAGNPGGGTFHIEIVAADGDYGMRVVDRPFEDVPQGGATAGLAGCSSGCSERRRSSPSRC